MTTISQFAQFRSIKNSLKVVAAGSIAIGVTAIMPAAPAQAISFTTGELDFGVSTSPFASLVSPAAGNTFSVNFTPTNAVTILNQPGNSPGQLGSFSPTFSPGSLGVNSPATGSFAFVSGSNYRLTNDLVFNFANSTSFTLRQNSTFVETEIFNSSGLRVGAGLQLANNAGSFFVNGGDITNIPTYAFSFTDTGVPSGGLYISQSTPTAVPEPFTVIGSIVGGTAAFRMRKKLANINKN